MTDLVAENPLDLLPSEITLRILDFTPIATLASLIRVSKAWRHFIDDVHQDAIYSATHRIPRPKGVRDFSFLNEWTIFSKCFEGATSWKEICKRYHCLEHNWNTERPTTTESIVQVGNSLIWRFKADFKRRLFMSTSHAGGFVVTDMDTGKPLWSRTQDEVRSYAHLEYEDGIIVWDRFGNALEVWETGLPGLARGEFRPMAILHHDSQTRGFHLLNKTLCVSSSDGVGHVYDMNKSPPCLVTRLDLELGAIGHLYQDDETVIYSFGNDGYSIFRKLDGAFLYHLDPSKCAKFWHIQHPDSRHDVDFDGESHGPSANSFPLGNSQDSRLTPLHVEPGPLPKSPDDRRDCLGRDEWGAGIISDDLFVGISRNGRVLMCPKYAAVVSKDVPIEQHSFIIECESDGRLFEFGGWLAVKDNRVMFEVQSRIYVVALDDDGQVYEDGPKRASFSMTTSSAPQLSVPVSMMALFDDCIMTTYTTLGRRQPRSNGHAIPESNGHVFPTKTIRILCFAPELETDGEEKPRDSKNVALSDKQIRTERLMNLYLAPMEVETINEQEALLQIWEEILDSDDEGDVMDDDGLGMEVANEEDSTPSGGYDEEEVYFTASESGDEVNGWSSWSDVDDELPSIIDEDTSTFEFEINRGCTSEREAAEDDAAAAAAAAAARVNKSIDVDKTDSSSETTFIHESIPYHEFSSVTKILDINQENSTDDSGINMEFNDDEN